MLIGENVILRPLKEDDSAKTVIWRNDLELISHTQGIRFPKSSLLEAQWFQSVMTDKSDRSVFLAIELTDNNEFIGIIQANSIDQISGTCELGILIGENLMRGKGLGREAIELMMHYLYTKLNLRKISLRVVSFNQGATRLYEKLGFVKEGILVSQYYWDNKYHDVSLYAHFRKSVTNEL